MDKTEIFKLINANPMCHLATAEGDTPHVRGMMMYNADESGIVFHTGKAKDLSRQLIANPKVEFCFFDQASGTQIRVSGKVEAVDDTKFKQEIVKNREFLKPIVDQLGFDVLSVYRVKNLRATVWSFETNLAPKTYINLS